MAPEPDNVRFGRFQLDPARRVLHVDGKAAKLSARAVDVLVALVQRRDRAVGKDELLDLVWPGNVVEENNLQVHVSALRKLLGAESIVTIPGRGYQFVAIVENPANAALHPAQPLETDGTRDIHPVHATLLTKPPALFGRDHDLVAVAELLDANALVTLAGPAGIGKTALAHAVAHSLRASFSGGVWWVDLSTVRDAALVVPQVWRTLGIATGEGAPEAEIVGAALRDQSLLLVLDNCEHLLEATAALVHALLHRAPQLRVLATSQESLRVSGEQVYRLSTLSVADSDLACGNHSGALQLFAARARAAVHEFSLTRENLAAVGEICRRLDGLPLAIELAAARLPLLGLDGIRSRLDERFRLLSVGSRLGPARHQALQAAFDWSHDLLCEAEQATFRRLGVFVGGFSLTLAQRVSAVERADEWQVLTHLGALVDKSLVVVEGTSTPRYRLLESMRAFALDRLAEANEVEQVRQSHAQALRAMLEEMDRDVVRAPRFDLVMRRFEPELDNLRAALAWAVENAVDRELAVALLAPSDWLWNETELWREGWQWCWKVLSWNDDRTPLAMQARLRLTAAGLGRVTMRPEPEWAGWAEQAAAGFRSCGDDVGLYRALCLLGQTHAWVTHERAGQYLDEAGRIEDRAWSPRLRLRRASALGLWYHLGGELLRAREAGRLDVRLSREAGGAVEVAALSNLADTERALGNHDVAIELCREAIARAAELGRSSAAVHAYATLAPVLLELGRTDDAAEELRRGRDALVRAVGTAFSLLPYLPVLAQARGDHRLAAQLTGCAVLTYQRTGRAMWTDQRGICDGVLEALKSKLPPATIEALLAEGGSWDEDEAFVRATT